MKLTIQLPFAAGIENDWNYPRIPPCSFLACTGTCVFFFLFCLFVKVVTYFVVYGCSSFPLVPDVFLTAALYMPVCRLFCDVIVVPCVSQICFFSESPVFF